MNEQMKISLDDGGKAVLLRCPLWANDLVRSLPSVRWSKSNKAWAAPLVRLNAEKLLEFVAMGGVETDPPALAAIKGSMADKVRPKGAAQSFPAWYKFKTEPMGHQRGGLAKLYPLRAAGIFYPMQTGKTKTAIDLLAAHRMEGHLTGALILTKFTLRQNIAKQFRIHCPIDYRLRLLESGMGLGWAMHDFPIAVAGWESLSQGGMAKLCEEFLHLIKRPALVGDEITYITNHKAERSKRAVELARMCDYVYGLTGTPHLEGPMNLFMEFEFLDPQIIGIGDFYAFRNRHAIMGGYQREVAPGKKVATQIVGYQKLEELTRAIAPFIHEVAKEEAIPDLPPKRFEVRTVQVTKKQRELLIALNKSGSFKLAGSDEVVMKNVLELALRKHQITGGYAVKPREEIKTVRSRETGELEDRVKVVYDPVELVAPKDNPKVQEVVSIVEEVGHKKQGLIWAVYMPEIRAILSQLKRMGLRIGELHGGVPERDRQPMVDEFERGGIDWVVGNASTGGMGYTMMAASVSVFYNNTFKMIDRVQAEDRPWGKGQTKSGVWIDIVAEKTVDETVMDALAEKQDLDTYLRMRIREAVKLLDGRA